MDINIDVFSDEELHRAKQFVKDEILQYHFNKSKLGSEGIAIVESLLHYYPNDEKRQLDLFLAIYCTMATAYVNTGQIKKADRHISEYFFEKFKVREVLDREVANINLKRAKNHILEGGSD